MPRLGIPQVEVPYNFLSGEKLLELPKMINICFHDSDSHSIFEPFTLCCDSLFGDLKPLGDITASLLTELSVLLHQELL